MLIGCAMWIANLANKVENQALAQSAIKADIKDIYANRASIDAEIIQELKSQAISISVLETKMDLLIKMQKNEK